MHDGEIFYLSACSTLADLKKATLHLEYPFKISRNIILWGRVLYGRKLIQYKLFS